MGGVGDGPNVHTNRNVTIDAWIKSSTSAVGGEQRVLQERILVIVGYVECLPFRLAADFTFRTYSVGKERIVKGGSR